MNGFDHGQLKLELEAAGYERVAITERTVRGPHGERQEVNLALSPWDAKTSGEPKRHLVHAVLEEMGLQADGVHPYGGVLIVRNVRPKEEPQEEGQRPVDPIPPGPLPRSAGGDAAADGPEVPAVPEEELVG